MRKEELAKAEKERAICKNLLETLPELTPDSEYLTLVDRFQKANAEIIRLRPLANAEAYRERERMNKVNWNS